MSDAGEHLTMRRLPRRRAVRSAVPTPSRVDSQLLQTSTDTDRVDDAVAEIFLTAWRRIDDVPAGDEALLWLYRVAYRVIGHEWRSAARRRRLGDRMQSMARPAPLPGIDETSIQADECRLVLEAATRLGGSDAEVLRLVAWEQLSIADVAEVLGIATNAVNQRLHRARRNLGNEYRRLESRQFSTPDAPQGGNR